MKIAVIDLGTNTFNLLVAEVSDGQMSVLYKNELGIKLGEGGIHRKIITEASFRRGLRGLEKHLRSAKEWEVDKVLAVATSGIRSAENGEEFIREADYRYGIQVRTITGEEEAELIYRGVRQAVNMGDKTCLIVDIGGGSNEFIIGSRKQYFWKKSIDIGIARILEQFKPSDPITQSEIEQINAYFEESLQPIYKAIRQYQPELFIGCSGTFQTVRNMLIEEGVPAPEATQQSWFEIYYAQFKRLHDRLILSTTEERKQMPGLELFRVDMIVLASLFVNFIMQKFAFDRMVQSDYSIKEGIVDQYINP
jgi:exopolyphosphatase / guanosine-5'-triphosphate,3'-diphosphate pyrophosphatase